METRAADPALARFATVKQAQIREFAQTLTNKVPTAVWSFFDAVRVDDWDTATNLFERLQRASGRFANSAPDDSISPALATVIWPPISEMIGTYEQFHNFDSKWLHRFGSEIIDSIPRGSIYFGGTDPGRFVISALSESHSEGKPFFTITQNQLADGTYLEYLRNIYGKKLYIPTTNDSATAFQNYLEDAQKRQKEGKLKPGEDIRTVNGRVQASGQVSVMEINGLIVKIIVEKNPDREFYVEESFPLDWMYPQLSPHGLIMKLHPKRLGSLDPAEIRKDQAFWKKLTTEAIGDWINEKTSAKELSDFADRVFLEKNLKSFKGDPAYAKNEEAQKTFSKLRSSIGGLYVWRAQNAREKSEKMEAQNAADLAFRQAYALCPSSPEAVFRYANLLKDLNRSEDAFLLAKTSLRLDPENTYFKDLVRALNKAD
jgi:hypothetical protein